MAERILTIGEINLAKKVFKSSIDYVKVKVHDEKYIFFQPSNSGMTPNGEIYVDGVYYADYSATGGSLQGFFIHEMAHVWQYQNNILDPISAAIGEAIRHGFNYGDAYKYTLDASKDLLAYKIEQQAAIIEDYFRTTFSGLLPVPGHMQNSYVDVQKNQLFQKVLSKFMANPSYAKHNIECNRQTTGHPSQRRIICRRVLQS